MKIDRTHKAIEQAKSLVSPQFFALEEKPSVGGWFHDTKSKLEVIGYLPETTEAVMINRETKTLHAVIGNTIRTINKNDLEDITKIAPETNEPENIDGYYNV